MPSGRTTLTPAPGWSAAFWVVAPPESSSVVTLRDLELRGGSERALGVESGGRLTVENVAVRDNAVGGVLVLAGGALYADAATTIADNGSLASGEGGGIACGAVAGPPAFISFAGQLERNRAIRGGNLYVVGDCEVHLEGGAVFRGTGQDAAEGDRSANSGGGIFMDGGKLFAHGGADRVVIRDHYASGSGGGLLLIRAEAVLVNTVFLSNAAGVAGGGIASLGSSLTMDRAGPCPFLISCSQLSRNRLRGGTDGAALYQEAGEVHLLHTMIDRHGPATGDGLDGLVDVWGGGADFPALTLDGVGLVLNEAGSLFRFGGATKVVAQYVTAARNSSGTGGDPTVVQMLDSTLELHSSIFDDTSGLILLGGGAGNTAEARCLLVDDPTGWPAGSYVVDTPLFKSAETGDIRQVAESPGVDFCDESAVPWPGGVDIELQARGFDSPANPNGSPGVPGGLFDVGMDEVSPLPPTLFADGFESGGTGAWSATVP